MTPRLDREGLNYLAAMHTKVALAITFGVTLPTLRKYLKGEEPGSIAVVRKINSDIEAMMKKRRTPPKGQDGHPWRNPVSGI